MSGRNPITACQSGITAGWTQACASLSDGEVCARLLSQTQMKSGFKNGMWNCVPNNMTPFLWVESPLTHSALCVYVCVFLKKERQKPA